MLDYFGKFLYTLNLQRRLMKRHINIMMVLVLGFVLSACSGRMVQLPTENIKAKKVPAWYLNHADTGKEGFIFRDGFYYAVAVAVSPDMEMSQKKAVLKAKAKITDRINGEMNNKTSINYSEKGASESMTGTVEAQDVIVNMIKQTVLRTYSVEKKLTIYNTEKSNYRSFVLMKISKKDVENIINLVEDKNNKKLLSKLKLSNTSDKVLKQSER
jgi:hypothetical protein